MTENSHQIYVKLFALSSQGRVKVNNAWDIKQLRQRLWLRKKIIVFLSTFKNSRAVTSSLSFGNILSKSNKKQWEKDTIDFVDEKIRFCENANKKRMV